MTNSIQLTFDSEHIDSRNGIRMKKIITLFLIIIMTSLFSGCTYGLLYTDITTPRSYRSATALDTQDHEMVATNVNGIACSQSFLFLIAIGDGGYDAAVKNALEKNDASMLNDVKADITYTAYLGPVYIKICTSVTGNAVK